MTNSDWIQLIAYACMLGAAWGHLRAGQARNGRDIASIKKALGLENGQPGIFVRDREWRIAEVGRNAQVDRIEEELANLRGD